MQGEINKTELPVDFKQPYWSSYIKFLINETVSKLPHLPVTKYFYTQSQKL